MPTRLAAAEVAKLPSMTIAMFRLVSRLNVPSDALRLFARIGEKVNGPAQMANCDTAQSSDGMRTSRRVISLPRLSSEGRFDGRTGSRTMSITTMASTAVPAAAKKAREGPPHSFSAPVTLVAAIRAMELTPESSAVMRTASSGGNWPLTATTSSTHTLAARPVSARPTISPLIEPVSPIHSAPSPASANPARMNGLRRPIQSAAMPNGKRVTACQRPYCAITMPTKARSSVFVFT